MAISHFANGTSSDSPSFVNGGEIKDHDVLRPIRAASEDGVMPIAVVGMACRFPGGSSSPEKLWEMLVNKRSGWSKTPAERFTQDSFEHPSSSVGGTFNSKGAHFLDEDVSLFDAPAFNISPLEAKAMDPQMRLQLEVVYEALENGGITFDRIAGSKTAVYIGVFSDDYSNMMLSDPESLPSHHVTGTGKAIFANRISYYFDLKGPSLSLDTGCSASLVALHQACQGIRCGESAQAIVGGTNLILSPKTMMSLGGLGFLSDEGRCYSFDSRGSGYGRGEGVASIVIKPLKDALANGDPIRAVIRNTVVNQDGRTIGLTMPSCEAQIAMMRDAYAQARLDPLDTRYVEAHGTGTKAGDPIEVEAIAAALSSSRDPSEPLFVGSVKANIGHLESASGLAGLIKAILCLEKGMIAPSINFETENKELQLQERCMKIATELQPWPSGALRRASLNSFGYGGTNAHVILDAYDHELSAASLGPTLASHTGLPNDGCQNSELSYTTSCDSEDRRMIVLLSHRTRVGVLRVAEELRKCLSLQRRATDGDYIESLAYSLNTRRNSFNWKAVVSAGSPQELARALNTQTLEPRRILQDQRLSFIFTGQGAQWYAMGRELIARYKVFGTSLRTADRHIKSFGASWSLVDELSESSETSRVSTAAVSQPLCTAIQCALVDLLGSWNVKPVSVTGHSSGEIAAAYACGSLNLESALTVSYHRGLLASTILERSTKLRGSMLAAGISEAETQNFINRIPAGKGKAVVACVNSPRSVTLSGDRPAVMSLQSMLEARQIFVRKLGINTAYHSHHMDIVAATYLDSLRSLPKPESNGIVAFFSSVTGDAMSGEELDAAYWVRNMVSQVKFSQSLQKLHEASSPDKNGIWTFTRPTVQILLEIGPHGALSGFVKQTLGAIPGAKFRYLSTLSRGRNAIDTMLTAASELAVYGHPINLGAVNHQVGEHPPRVLVDLPPYPWDHCVSYWHESRLSSDYRKRSAPRHPLLGAPAQDFNRLEPSWRNIIQVSEIPWVRGHVIQSNIVYPGAGYVAMAVEAALQRSRLNGRIEAISRYRLKDISIGKPLLIPDTTEGIETQFILRPYNRSAHKSSDIWDEFRVFSYTGSEGWSEHCRGLIAVQHKESYSEVEGDRESRCKMSSLLQTIDAARVTCQSVVGPEQIYEALKAIGIQFQDGFQCIEDVVVGARQSIGHIRIPDTAEVMPKAIEHPHVIHPTTLDACMQMTSSTLLKAGVLRTPMVPTFIEEILIAGDIDKRAGDRFLVHTDTLSSGKQSFKSQITAIKEDAARLESAAIEINGLVCTAIPNGGSSGAEALEDHSKCHRLKWELDAEFLDNEDVSNLPRNQDNTAAHSSKIILVQPTDPSLFSQSIASNLSSILGNRLISMSTNLEDIADAASTDRICICLAEMDGPILSKCTQTQWTALRKILSSASKVLWVTRGGAMEIDSAEAGLITGLARGARSDNNALRLVTLDMDSKQESAEDAARLIPALLEKTFLATSADPTSSDIEYAERSGQVYIPRIVEDNPLQQYVRSCTAEPEAELQLFFKPGRPLRLEVATPGLLDSLRFIEDATAALPLAAHELRMQPKAYGVNFRDVMVALGQLESTSLMSSEHSGIVTEVGKDLANQFRVGDRICAWGGNAYASSVTVSGLAAQRIPDGTTFETAASIPIVYATVYYSLVHLARIQQGESLLIHSAAGGVGQAAVMLAKYLGARVFATVGSSEKKSLVMKTYDIPEDHIFSSRELTFAAGVKRLTHGKGVDVVLNSIAGEAFHETFKCLAKLGRFIEIGKRDILADSRLDMRTFNKSVTFASVDLTILFEFSAILAKRMVTEVFALLEHGAVRPVQPLNVFSLSEVESAFRLIQAGKHTGKVILKTDENTIVKALPRSTASTKFTEDASFVLVGGLGGLGRAICRWMATRNYKNIIVLSRSGQKSEHATTLKEELAGSGVNLVAYACDVSDREQLEDVLNSCAKDMPPIKGIIQSAMVIRDALIDKMTLEDYQDVLRPKVQGTLNLHEALSNTPLNFFIMLSSCVGIIGNNGQANYASACTFQDAFARHRTSLGKPTRSLDLGMIEGAGYVSENAEVAKFLTAQGFQPVKVDELLALLDYAISEPIRSIDDCQLMIGLMGSNSQNEAMTFADAKFSDIRASQNVNATAAASQPMSLQSQIKAASSASEIHHLVLHATIGQISKVLVVPVEDINPAQALSNYGGDSLAAVELRNWFARNLDASVGVMAILSGKSIDALVGEVVASSKLAEGSRRMMDVDDIN